jgi:hypothetical protein
MVELPDFAARADAEHITLILDEEELVIKRLPSLISDEPSDDELPEDVADELPG